jgi:hypothetical protein
VKYSFWSSLQKEGANQLIWLALFLCLEFFITHCLLKSHKR